MHAHPSSPLVSLAPHGLAATVPERLAQLRAGDGLPEGIELDPEAGRTRLGRWAAQRPFATPHTTLFAQRLLRWGTDPSSLQRALAWRSAADGPVPARLAACYDGTLPCSPRYAHPHPIWSVRTWLHPLFERSVREVLRRAPASPLLPDPDALAVLLHRDIPVPDLHMMCARVLVLELNIARMRDQLTGDDPRARATHFRERLRDPAVALEVLQRWPVLARQLDELFERWVDVRVELLQRLADDAASLQRTFWPDGAPRQLVHLASGGGDHHAGRRAVTFLRFARSPEDEEVVKVVYKPRPYAVDTCFRSLLRWVCDTAGLPPVPVRTLLDRGDHGYEAFVEATPCDDEAGVDRFYQRLGVCAAVLSVLDATDLHGENVLACGDVPELLDLECLFQPRAYAHTGADGHRLADGDEFYTVLRTGLLPRLVAQGDTVVDLSAVGSGLGPSVRATRPVLRDEGTDSARYVEESVLLDTATRSRPTLRSGAPVHPSDHLVPLMDGFRRAYRALAAHREELLAPGGRVHAFAQAPVRVLARHTRVYGELLHASFHPDFLRDAARRDQLLDKLWIDVPHRSWLAELVEAERTDLLAVDIPVFTCRPGARDLWDSRGRRRVDFYDEAALDWVARRMRRLDERDLDNQLYAIRASLGSLAARTGRPLPPTVPCPLPDTDPLERLGDWLHRRALVGNDYAFWVGLRPRASDASAWSADVLGGGLHTGTAGIGLVLCELGRRRRRPEWSAVGAMALRSTELAATRLLGRDAGDLLDVGLRWGWGGMLFALAEHARRRPWPTASLTLQRIVDHLHQQAPHVDDPSVAHGLGGARRGLVAAARVLREERVSAALAAVHEALAARGDDEVEGIERAPEALWCEAGLGDAVRDDTVAWRNPVGLPSPELETGVAGVAYALLRRRYDDVPCWHLGEGAP